MHTIHNVNMHKPLFPSVSYLKLVFLYLPLWLGFTLCSGSAFGQGLSLIRDAEIEDTLRIYGTPVFEAAGLEPSAVNVYVINSRDINAYVSGGQNIFLHTGLLMAAKNAETVIGVMAHETGHIAGGHLIKGNREVESAFSHQLIALGLGMVAAAGGQGQLAAAVVSAGGQFNQRSLLAFSRSQEQIADNLGLQYLHTADMPATGLLEMLEKFRRNESNNLGSQTPYVVTHPLSKERISHIRGYVMDNQPQPIVSKELGDLHLRLLGKLTGFLSDPDEVIRQNVTKNTLYSRYALAVAYYRKSEKEKSVKIINSLLLDYPRDPYFYEFKGQVLFENGDIQGAIKNYSEALNLKPQSPLMKIELAQSFIASNTPPNLNRAVDLLKQASIVEDKNGVLWQLLSEAYDKLGNKSASQLAAAELFTLQRKYDNAIQAAKKVQLLARENSPEWLRAKDIEDNAKELKDKKDIKR